MTEGNDLNDIWTGNITYPTDHEFTLVRQEPEYVIQINGNNNKLMVGIKPDGTLVCGENYDPDEAAKIFWKALIHHMPGITQPTTEPKATPWAVICREHGKQFLTEEQYNNQMMNADSFWFCPVCGGHSEWDDDNYEEHYFKEEDDHGQT